MRAPEIRRATKDDADAIANVMRGLGDHNIGLPGDWKAERVREWIGRLGEDGMVIVAYDGSIPAAFGALDFNTTSRKPDCWAFGCCPNTGERAWRRSWPSGWWSSGGTAVTAASVGGCLTATSQR